MSDRVRRIVHGAADGARNMATDEALMEAAREGGMVLRFYRWDPPSLSLGRNQEARDLFDPEAADRRGIDIVRRPTGGRAVFHHRELTYAVTAPAGRWGGLRASYRRINRALLTGLSRLGADVAAAGRSPSGRAPGPSGRACFRDPLPGEIVAAGRKLVGSAQWREGGALLQHGSLLLHDDQGVVEALRREAAGAGARRPSGAASLADLLPDRPAHDRLVEALTAGMVEEFGLERVDSELGGRERRRARDLEARYRDPEWTWRR